MRQDGGFSTFGPPQRHFGYRWPDQFTNAVVFFAFCGGMTILTIMVKSQHSWNPSWTIAEAKARFSEVVDRARNAGPQLVKKRGREAVVVVSVEEWERKTRRAGTLADFFAASPLRNSGIELHRRKERPRKPPL